MERALDADNRLLWRKSPGRLEAEAMRDALLAVSGVLDAPPGRAELSGLPLLLLQGVRSSTSQSTRSARRSIGARSIAWGRAAERNPFLDTFDCPDPRPPRRAARRHHHAPPGPSPCSTTPSSCTSPSNSPGACKPRLGPDLDRQITRTYALAYGRAPEGARARPRPAVVARHGLAAFCRVVFNSNEFMQID